jgi:hypothetical protein
MNNLLDDLELEKPVLTESTRRQPITQLRCNLTDLIR